MRNAVGTGAADMPELSTETPKHYTALAFYLRSWKKKRPVRIQSSDGTLHGRASSVIRRRKRSGGSRARLYGFAHTHLFSVVAKILAAIEAEDVRSVALAPSPHLSAPPVRGHGPPI